MRKNKEFPTRESKKGGVRMTVFDKKSVPAPRSDPIPPENENGGRAGI